MSGQPDLYAGFDGPSTDTEGRPLPDLCARKHGGNPESGRAFERLAPHIRESHADILAWLTANGPGTAKEYAAARGLEFNCCSGRWSELKRAGRIVPTGERRDGAAVYRVA